MHSNSSEPEPQTGDRTPSVLAVLLLLLPLLTPLALTAGTMEVQAQGPPPVGDWDVSGDESLSDTEVVVTGNISVPFGATLKLDNVTVIMNCSFNGEFNFTVGLGGKLVMRNSTIRPADLFQFRRYNFLLRIGSIAEIYDSQLVAIGAGNLSVPSTLGLYVETSGATIANCNFTRVNLLYLAAGIVVAPLASPKIEGNRFSGVYLTGISLILGSNALIKGNEVLACGVGLLSLASAPTVVDNDFHSNLVAMQFSSGSATLRDNTIRNNIVNGIGTDDVDLNMQDDVFIDNANDMTLNQSSLLAQRMRTRGTGGGISIDGSGPESVRIEDSVLGVESPEALTINDSTVHLVNTTFDRDNVLLPTEVSHLHVWWYLNISVSKLSGDPAAGATINVLDVDNSTVYQGQADADGEVVSIDVEEYEQTGTNRTFYTPHTVKATLDQISGSVAADIDRTRWVNLTLDDINPQVTITEPEEGLLTNSSTVAFRGTASDADGISVVEYKLASGPWSPANGTTEWNFTIDLDDGDHLVQVRAADPTGNTGVAKVNVTVDTISPILLIMTPKDGTITNKTPIDVEGRTEAGALLQLAGGVNITVAPDGGFAFQQDLSEGTNIIGLTATDAAGNDITASVTVTLDTVPPVLNVTAPRDGLITNSSAVRVEGTAEDAGGNVTVTINGLPVEVDAGGGFSAEFLLSDGEHTFAISATDRAGNSVAIGRTVVVDTTPPELEVEYPEDGLLTNTPLVPVRGRADTSDVDIGALEAEPLQSTGGWWLIDELYPLVEGRNDIVVAARDEAGNTASVTIVVTLDTIPPLINVTEPLDGYKTHKDQITIMGTTEPGAVISVNGIPVTDTDGSFSIPFTLVMGQNAIVINVTDEAGNSDQMTLTVTRERKETEPTTIDSTYSLLFLVLVIAAVAVFMLAYKLARHKKDEDQGTDDEADGGRGGGEGQDEELKEGREEEDGQEEETREEE